MFGDYLMDNLAHLSDVTEANDILVDLYMLHICTSVDSMWKCYYP